jgi:hypothetical protein
MSMFSNRRRAVAVVLLAASGVLAGVGVVAAPASAAVLFADNFEQPTRNVWLTGGGGAWSVVGEDGSTVYRQSATTLTPTAWAGSGSGAGTVVTARIKPTSVLGPADLVAVAGRVSDPNNLYYAGVRDGRLELGQVAWGRNRVLATTPFAVGTGSWYTASLSFLTAGSVTAVIVGPGGASATVSAVDPGGASPGDRVGFYTRTASASFDDLTLSNTLPPSSPPTGTCPAAITIRIGVDYGTAFTATLTFRNISSTTIDIPWTITWRFTDGQFVQGLFNGTWYQVGQVVTVRNTAWFPAVAPGATSGVPIGFTASPSGPGHPPVEATFNGLPCPLTFG